MGSAIEGTKRFPSELKLIFCYGKCIPPLWSLKGYWLETILNILQCFQRRRTPTGMNELSQQPSTDFGCRALQMQKRRFFVLIFTGKQHVVPNELSDMEFNKAWKYESESNLKQEIMMAFFSLLLFLSLLI